MTGKLNSEDNYAPPRKNATISQIIITLLNLLLTDIVLYGTIIPLIGAYLAGGLASRINATPKLELVLVVGLTFILMYGVFTLIGEVNFWKHLFAFESCYAHLLLIRDIVNVLASIICIFSLVTTIESLVNQKQGMQTVHMDEATMFQVLLRKISNVFGTDPTSLIKYKTKSGEPTAQELMMVDIGTSYIICWAMLTSCVAKLIYFNTLNVYVRSIEIFMSMNPQFGDDDNDDSLAAAESTESVLPDGRACSFITPKCRLERDLASTTKKLLRRC